MGPGPSFANQGVWKGCLLLCISPFAPTCGHKPSKHGGRAKRFASRHKAGVADADCVAGTKLILAVGSRDVEGTDSWQWTMAPWAIVEHDGRLSSLWCGPRKHLMSKSSSYAVEAISQALKKILKLIFKTPLGSWSFTPLSGTDKYSHKCLN